MEKNDFKIISVTQTFSEVKFENVVGGNRIDHNVRFDYQLLNKREIFKYLVWFIQENRTFVENAISKIKWGKKQQATAKQQPATGVLGYIKGPSKMIGKLHNIFVKLPMIGQRSSRWKSSGK